MQPQRAESSRPSDSTMMMMVTMMMNCDRLGLDGVHVTHEARRWETLRSVCWWQLLVCQKVRQQQGYPEILLKTANSSWLMM